MARPPRRNSCWVDEKFTDPMVNSANGCTGIKTPITFAILLAPKEYAPKAPAKMSAILLYASDRIKLIFNLLPKYFDNFNNTIAITAANRGQMIQVLKIFVNVDASVA